LGPIEKRPFGEKLNKRGDTIPSKYIWIDPRTPETLLRKSNGEYTKEGVDHKTFLDSVKLWPLVDPSIVSMNTPALTSPFQRSE
jgi:hypothetical protein